MNRLPQPVDSQPVLTKEIVKPEPVKRNERDENSIKMTGPLSEVYTKALQVVYAKKDNVTGDVGFESQANDVIMEVALKKAQSIKDLSYIKSKTLIPDTGSRDIPSGVVVYASYADNFNNASALTATNVLANNQLNNPGSRSILVVDGGDVTTKGRFNSLVDETDYVNPADAKLTVREAMENMCKTMGIEMYYSFETFVSSLRTK